jgi:transposase
MDQIRSDLQNNPKYLSEVIGVMDTSIKNLLAENSKLKEKLGDSQQDSLIELQDKIEMLNRRHFGNGKESLNKYRPIREKQRDLLPHNRSPLKEEVLNRSVRRELPEEEVIHEEASCPCCKGENIEEIEGLFEESEEVDIKASTLIKKRHKRKKFRCRDCEVIVTAKGPLKLRAKNKYSVDFAINAAVSKYSYHMPLERQSRLYEEQGVKIDTKTIFSQTEALYLNLYPVLDKIKDEILNYGYVHIDETRGKILSTNTNGYLWAMGNRYGAYFQYETTRSGEVALEMLGDFEGAIISDGFSGYNRVKKGNKVKVCYCWSHARRKFFDCLENYPKAVKVIQLIDEMFAIERKSKGSFKRLASLRSKKTKKIHKELFELLLKLEREALPRSGLGKAIAYTLNLWDGLSIFLTDAKIPLSNNLAERMLRNPVKGRDNYSGYRTINGADVAMFFYSVVETCKLLELNPRRYLKDQSVRHHEGLDLQTPIVWARDS